MTEEEFYKCTPKKLFKLAKIHHKLNTPKTEEEIEKENKESEEIKELYIDQIR